MWNRKHFQGVCRVTWIPEAPLEEEQGQSEPELHEFGVEWLRTCALPYTDTLGLHNPQAGMTPVAINPNWQELPVQLGKALMALIWCAPKVHINPSSLMKSASSVEKQNESSAKNVEELSWNHDLPKKPESEDLGTMVPNRVMPRPGMGMPLLPRHPMNFHGMHPGMHPRPPPRGMFPPTMPRGRPQSGPATGSGDHGQGSQGGPPPRPMAMAPHPAVEDLVRKWAHRDGFLFECDKDNVQECLRSRMFGGPESVKSLLDLNRVTRGTPIVARNISDGCMLGLFFADSDPGTYSSGALKSKNPQLGMVNGASVQVRLQDFLLLRPIPERLYAPAFPERPTVGPVPQSILVQVARKALGALPHQAIEQFARQILGQNAEGTNGSAGHQNTPSPPSQSQNHPHFRGEESWSNDQSGRRGNPDNPAFPRRTVPPPRPPPPPNDGRHEQLYERNLPNHYPQSHPRPLPQSQGHEHSYSQSQHSEERRSYDSRGQSTSRHQSRESSQKRSSDRRRDRSRHSEMPHYDRRSPRDSRRNGPDAPQAEPREDSRGGRSCGHSNRS